MSHPDAALYIQVPIFDTTVAVHSTVKVVLRKGLRDNPTKKHLEALAEFFGVSPVYFFDDAAAARIDAELELLAALRDAGVRQLALRAHGLSPASLTTLAHMIERVRELEGLPDAPRAQASAPEEGTAP